MPMKLKLKIVPGASRNGIAGWLGDALKIRVAAPPEKNKANKAVIRLLATTLDIHPRDIVIETGATSSRKVVHITVLNETEVLQRLSNALSP